MPCTSCLSARRSPPIRRWAANAVISSTSRSAAPRQRAADHQPLEAEPLVDEGHPGVLRPDQVGGRHPDVLERHDRVVVGDRVGVRRSADHADAGRVLVGDEQRLLAGVLPGGQHRLEEHVVGLVVRRHVPLHAVQDVVVTVARGRRLQVGDVGAGVLLGDRVALLAPALDGRQQVGLALVVVGHGGPPAGRRGEAPGEGVGDPAALLLHEDLLEGAAAATAELGRDVRRGQAELDGAGLEPVGDVLGELAVVLLGVLLVGDQLVGEAARAGLQLEVVGRESVHVAPLSFGDRAGPR